METIEIQTLIDVTNTGVTRANQGTGIEYDQYRNWTTLLQCIGLRCIIDYEHNSIVETIDIKNLGFGTGYKGKHRVWTFRFKPDRRDVFLDDIGNPIGLLDEDLNNVPVITKLTETININKSVFNTEDINFKNTLIKAI
jgi:hypothetical protein